MFKSPRFAPSLLISVLMALSITAVCLNDDFWPFTAYRMYAFRADQLKRYTGYRFYALSENSEGEILLDSSFISPLIWDQIRHMFQDLEKRPDGKVRQAHVLSYFLRRHEERGTQAPSLPKYVKLRAYRESWPLDVNHPASPDHPASRVLIVEAGLNEF